VFENRVLWSIYGPKRDEMVGWRKVHNEELHTVYSSPGITRIIKRRRTRWTGNGKTRNAYRGLMGKPEGKRSLGIRRREWMRWVEHVARMEAKRTAYRILVGKPEGKRLLGRPRRRWVDNIKTDLREIG
jgi:hypothetical protein